MSKIILPNQPQGQNQQEDIPQQGVVLLGKKQPKFLLFPAVLVSKITMEPEVFVAVNLPAKEVIREIQATGKPNVEKIFAGVVSAYRQYMIEHGKEDYASKDFAELAEEINSKYEIGLVMSVPVDVLVTAEKEEEKLMKLIRDQRF